MIRPLTATTFSVARYRYLPKKVARYRYRYSPIESSGATATAPHRYRYRYLMKPILGFLIINLHLNNSIPLQHSNPSLKKFITFNFVYSKC